MTVPDYVTPIVGYRGWLFHPEVDRLMSGTKEVWHPGRAMKAKCLCLNKPAHTSPQEDCTCGIYAVKLREDLFDGFSIYGEVYLWGKVIEYTHGYRAEYAYPKSLKLAPPAPEPISLWGREEDDPIKIQAIKTALNLLRRLEVRLRPKQFSVPALIEYGVEIRAHDGALLWRPSIPKPSRWLQ
jgi:hypothetical protein